MCLLSKFPSPSLGVFGFCEGCHKQVASFRLQRSQIIFRILSNPEILKFYKRALILGLLKARATSNFHGTISFISHTHNRKRVFLKAKYWKA